MQQSSPKIWLLGASFETSNMGVSALAEASLKCIFTQWPTAEVTLLTYGATDAFTIHLVGREHTIKKQELWFGRNIFKANNAYVLLFYALILTVLPIPALRRFLAGRNPHFKTLLEADLVVDITGGDSFSDIYGLRRYIMGSLLKWLAILCRRVFVLMPQTYGPFHSGIAKTFTRHLLARTSAIYSRDEQGLAYVNELLAKKNCKSQQIRAFIPDVAFTMDTEKPTSEADLTLLEQMGAAKQAGKTVIGLNISGLLYNDQDRSEQRFGIQDNYAALVTRIIQQFLVDKETVIVLIPHVFAPPEFESDPKACEDIYAALHATFPQQLLRLTDINLAHHRYQYHRQVKYLIGQCDFFMGSRMHACIGAMSQHVPTVGLAYSGKFVGVFKSAGVAQWVVDLRNTSQSEVLQSLQTAYAQRSTTAETLRTTLPVVQSQVLGLFKEVDTRFMQHVTQ